MLLLPTTSCDKDHDAALCMRGVSKRFGATVALQGVDLAVRAGEVLGLVGENGAGKSTLMNILSGVVRADEGAMRLFGYPYAPHRPVDARRCGVAMIHQELSIAPDVSVEANINLGMESSWFGWSRRRAMRALAHDALEDLGHGGLPLDMPVGRLPTALQQIVEIARATAAARLGGSERMVIVLDEPTSSLGRDDAARLFEVIDRLRQRGAAIIYISHFLEEIRRVAQRFVVLRDGQVIGEGEPNRMPTGDIVRMMVGRTVSTMYPRSSRTPGEVVLKVENLRGLRLPVHASLELRRGEVLGVVGLVGAGRTELLRAVFGLDRVRNGQVRVDGISGRRSAAARWRQGVGMLSEDRKREGLATRLNIADNITLPQRRRLGWPGFIWPARQHAHAAHWARALGVRCRSTSQRIGELSGGNQQKAALARLLAADVDVLLLDEPTRGIDVGSKAEIYRLIDDLATRGRAVLMVSSYIPELLGVADRIAVMSRGVLGSARPVEQWDEQSLLAAAIDVEDETDMAGGEPSRRPL